MEVRWLLRVKPRVLRFVEFKRFCFSNFAKMFLLTQKERILVCRMDI